MSIVTSNPKYKTISPYDLTSSDNPGAVISQPLLTGLHYDEWALNLRMALSSRKKFGFLDGSLPRPVDGSPHLEDWVANNHLIVGWIKQTIEPKIRSSISTREVAKDLWDIIQKRFSIKSGARLQQLRNSLATCKQNGSTVDDYFGRLTKIWDGIAECMNTKKCGCGKCDCDLNTAHEKEREILRVHDFLAGLDDSVHGVVRSQMCAITTLPDLDSVYQKIVQNETLHSNTTKEVAVMSFAAQGAPQSRSSTPVWTRDISQEGSRNNYNNRDPSHQCSVCGKTGHVAASCFKVIGYPEGWFDKSRNKSSGRGNSAGRGSGSYPRANRTQIPTANSVAMGSSGLLTDSDRLGLTGPTDDQWSIVQRMINAGKSTHNVGGPQYEDADWSG